MSHLLNLQEMGSQMIIMYLKINLSRNSSIKKSVKFPCLVPTLMTYAILKTQHFIMYFLLVLLFFSWCIMKTTVCSNYVFPSVMSSAHRVYRQLAPPRQSKRSPSFYPHITRQPSVHVRCPGLNQRQCACTVSRLCVMLLF